MARHTNKTLRRTPAPSIPCTDCGTRHKVTRGLCMACHAAYVPVVTVAIGRRSGSVYPVTLSDGSIVNVGACIVGGAPASHLA